MRSDITHKYLQAGCVVEGLSGKGFTNLPPMHADAVVCNNLAIPPYAVLAQAGVPGAYYEGGFQSGGGTFRGPDESNVTGAAGAKVIRNVFTVDTGPFGRGSATNDNLQRADMGNTAPNAATIPAAVTEAWEDPTGTTWDDIRDWIANFTPTVGSVLRSQGTNLIFGPIDVRDGDDNLVIDFRRHTYDRTALMTSD
jgi:hypothetical protein